MNNINEEKKHIEEIIHILKKIRGWCNQVLDFIDDMRTLGYYPIIDSDLAIINPDLEKEIKKEIKESRTHILSMRQLKNKLDSPPNDPKMDIIMHDMKLDIVKKWLDLELQNGIINLKKEQANIVGAYIKDMSMYMEDDEYEEFILGPVVNWKRLEGNFAIIMGGLNESGKWKERLGELYSITIKNLYNLMVKSAHDALALNISDTMHFESGWWQGGRALWFLPNAQDAIMALIAVRKAFEEFNKSHINKLVIKPEFMKITWVVVYGKGEVWQGKARNGVTTSICSDAYEVVKIDGNSVFLCQSCINQLCNVKHPLAKILKEKIEPVKLSKMAGKMEGGVLKGARIQLEDLFY